MNKERYGFQLQLHGILSKFGEKTLDMFSFHTNADKFAYA